MYCWFQFTCDGSHWGAAPIERVVVWATHRVKYVTPRNGFWSGDLWHQWSVRVAIIDLHSARHIVIEWTQREWAPKVRQRAQSEAAVELDVLALRIGRRRAHRARHRQIKAAVDGGGGGGKAIVDAHLPTLVILSGCCCCCCCYARPLCLLALRPRSFLPTFIALFRTATILISSTSVQHLLGPFHGAVTRCRCRWRRGHRCAGGARQYR